MKVKDIAFLAVPTEIGEGRATVVFHLEGPMDELAAIVAAYQHSPSGSSEWLGPLFGVEPRGLAWQLLEAEINRVAERRVRAYMASHFSTATIDAVCEALRGEEQ